MKKSDFMIYYDSVIKVLGEKFVKDYPSFKFHNHPDSVYEEYLNQKTILRIMYDKDSGNSDGGKRNLLDRHKVCACMLVAILKVRLLSGEVDETEDSPFRLSKALRINEQLAFMSAWELFNAFLSLRKEKELKNNSTNKEIPYQLPDTYHNYGFLDTITRSLFVSNQLNGLSTPLIANIFFLIEKYCEIKAENAELKEAIGE